MFCAHNRAVSWAGRAALLAGLVAAGDQRPPEIVGTSRDTTVGALKLSLDGPTSRTSVDVLGIATFFDANDGVLYLQDETGAIALRVGNPGARVAPGTRLRVTGEMQTRTTLAPVERARLTALELGAPLPDPRPISVAALLEGRAPAEWVELPGSVRAVARRSDSLLLELEDAGRRIQVAAPLDMDDACLLGSSVRVRGVHRISTKPEPRGKEVLLAVP